MSSTQSISFRKRKDVDEIYTLPISVDEATLQITTSVVMVEYLDDDEVLIIAGNLPGLSGYFDNYPDVDGAEKQRRYEFAQELLPEAKTYLTGYDPQESTSSSNSGNRSMEDLYVEIERAKRDEVVMAMWQMLNWMKDRYIEFLGESDEDVYIAERPLETEVVDISKRLDCG